MHSVMRMRWINQLLTWTSPSCTPTTTTCTFSPPSSSFRLVQDKRSYSGVHVLNRHGHGTSTKKKNEETSECEKKEG